MTVELSHYIKRAWAVETITNASMTVVNNYTVTDNSLPGNNGDEYMMICKFLFGGSNTTERFNCEMRYGSTFAGATADNEHISIVEPRRSNNSYGHLQTYHHKFTKTAGNSHFIGLQSDGVDSAHGRNFEAWFVNLTELTTANYLRDTDATSRTNSTWTEVCSVTTPASGTNDWGIWYTTHWESNDLNTAAQLRLVVDGTTVWQSDNDFEHGSEEYAIGGFMIATALGASKVVKLEMQSESSQHACDYGELFLFRCDAMNQHWTNIDSNVPVSIAATSTLYNVEDIYDMDPNTDSAVMMFCSEIHDVGENTKGWRSPNCRYRNHSTTATYTNLNNDSEDGGVPGRNAPHAGSDELCTHRITSWDMLGSSSDYDCEHRGDELSDASPAASIVNACMLVLQMEWDGPPSTTNEVTKTDSIAVADTEAYRRHRDREALDSITAGDVPVMLRRRDRESADSINVGDADVEQRHRDRESSDSITAGDGSISLRDRIRASLDAITAVDTDVELRHRDRGILDTAAVSDTPAMQRYRVRAFLDSIDAVDSKIVQLFGKAGGDGIRIKRFRYRETQDSIAVVDFVVATIRGTITRKLLDSISVTDACQTERERWRALQDPIAVADSILTERLRDRAIFDAVGITDAEQISRVRRQIVSDALEVLDTIAPTRERWREAFDDVTVTDASEQLRLMYRVLADNITAVDSFETRAINIRALSDAIDITDSIQMLRSFERTIGDSIEVTDLAEMLRQFFRAQLDSITATDSVDATYVPPQQGDITNRVLTDSIAVFDAILKICTIKALDSCDLTDAVDTQRYRTREKLDTVMVEDAIRMQRLRYRMNADNLEVGDGITVSAFRKRTSLDSIDVSDDTLSQRFRYRLFADSINLSDALISGIQRLVSVILSDSIDVTDAEFHRASRVVIAADAITVTDNALTLRLRNRTILDAFDITDAVSAERVFEVEVNIVLDFMKSFMKVGMERLDVALGLDRVPQLQILAGMEREDIELGMEGPPLIKLDL